MLMPEKLDTQYLIGKYSYDFYTFTAPGDCYHHAL